MTGSVDRRSVVAAVAAVAAALLSLPSLAVAVPTPARLRDAWGALQSYDLPRVRELLAAERREQGSDPSLDYLEAVTSFYGGDYPRAMELLGPDGVAGPHWGDPGLPGFIRDTARAVQPLKGHASEHFVLYVDDERDWVLVEPGLAVLERSYEVMGRLFGVVPREPLRVEIFRHPDDFQKASSLTVKDIETSGAIGISKFNKIMMISPRTLAYGYRWLDTLAHEYLHHLVVMLTGDQAPIWVQEGIAKSYENAWESGRPDPLWPAGEALLARALANDTLIPFEAMDPSLVKLKTVEEVGLAYAECSTAIDFILGRVGREGLLGFLAGIRERGTRGTREALRQAIGLDFTQFQEAWRAHLGTLGLRRNDAIRLMQPRLAGEPMDEETLFSDLRSEAARGHLRLGDSLTRQGRLTAALAEFKRALRETPDSPTLLNRAGLAAARSGDAAQARELLERAATLAPDYPQTYLNLADALMQLERWDEARERYSEYTEINPYNPAVYRLRGMAHLKLARPDLAIDDWSTALRLDPSDERLRGEFERLRATTHHEGG